MRVRFHEEETSFDQTLVELMNIWLSRRLVVDKSELTSQVNSLDSPQEINKLFKLASADWWVGKWFSNNYQI